MITVRECTYNDKKRYDELEGEYHYMGDSHGAGDTIRLIFEENGKWIALMTWAASCYALKARDERIGWNPALRVPRLKLIINNRRFTLLNKKGTRPNLASQILGLAIRELPKMWQCKWGYTPLLAETFCDIEHSAGTCYRAAGWEEVGQTRGFSRVRHSRDFYIPNGKAKVLFMKPLRPNAWELICSKELPEECRAATHTKAIGVLPFNTKQVDDLFWELCHVEDPRGKNYTFSIGTLLTLYVMAAAAGAKDLKEVVAFAKRLTNKQLKELGCPPQKDVYNKPINGKYVCPSYMAFYNLIAHKDKAGRHNFSLDSFAEHLSNWMTAQAGTLPKHLAADGKFVKETVGIVSFVDAESKEVVAVAPLSRKEGVKGKCELPMTQKTLAKMDLSDTVVTTDALGCQTLSAQMILERGGDYVFQVKGNQKSLLENCEQLSKCRSLVDSVKKKELNKDRYEKRETYVYCPTDPADADFPGCKAIIRTYREIQKLRRTGKYDYNGKALFKPIGKPSKEIVYHVSSLDPYKHAAAAFADIIRGHWQVEVYHNKRDGGYHEDLLTRRGNDHLMTSMLIARTLGMWICARNPDKTTNEVKHHLNLNPNELVEIVTKGGLQ